MASKPACFGDYRLGTAFQPIFSLSHRRIVGFEALLRARTLAADEPVSPPDVFASAQSQEALLTLDDACQRLHIHGFADHAPADRWLFLNMDPATITHGHYRDGFLERTLASAGLPFERLVVAILEGAIDDETVLKEAVAFFRERGALVALDDFGAGYSNFDRIWRLAPDIIKLDRSIIAETEQHRSGKLQRMLPNLVSLMHEAGSLVLVEGIENEAQGLIALDADVDFVQGFYLARPQARIADHPQRVARLDRMTRDFVDTELAQDSDEQRKLAPFVHSFRAVVSDLERGRDSRLACQPLLDMRQTARCYLLDERGEEIAHWATQRHQKAQQERVSPIVDTAGGSWFRRQYFRNALDEPRRMQISRPYLSSTATHMCVTLSICIKMLERRIFCCDVFW